MALDASIPVGHKLVVFGTLNDETKEGKLLLDEVVVRSITRLGYFKKCLLIYIFVFNYFFLVLFKRMSVEF